MKATIDGAGRLVVPKSLRDALGLVPGQELELEVRDGRLEAEALPTPMRLRRRGPRMAAVPEATLPPLSAAQVRATLERIRR